MRSSDPETSQNGNMKPNTNENQQRVPETANTNKNVNLNLLNIIKSILRNCYTSSKDALKLHKMGDTYPKTVNTEKANPNTYQNNKNDCRNCSQIVRKLVTGMYTCKYHTIMNRKQPTSETACQNQNCDMTTAVKIERFW